MTTGTRPVGGHLGAGAAGGAGASGTGGQAVAQDGKGGQQVAGDEDWGIRGDTAEYGRVIDKVSSMVGRSGTAKRLTAINLCLSMIRFAASWSASGAVKHHFC